MERTADLVARSHGPSIAAGEYFPQFSGLIRERIEEEDFLEWIATPVEFAQVDQKPGAGRHQ